MPSPKIADVLRIQRRFLRSANLQRDFRDPVVLDGYVVTNTVRSHLKRIMEGLPAKSGQRSWRITGDYGSGKSSFALLLAHCFAGKDSSLPPQVRRALDLDRPLHGGFLPVLITGSREALATAVLRGLLTAVDAYLPKRQKCEAAESVRKLLAKTPPSISDNEALDLIAATNSDLIASGHAKGLFIILDELGKFLEFAALHPERQDIYFLQQLAETSARSASEPIFTVGLLHQGFGAYADQLSQSAQREWEKVAGRFEELFFDQPLDQVTHLLAAALNVSESLRPRGVESRFRRTMREAVNLGWFGSAPASTALQETAPNLYPLHPTVLPVLVKLFSRFGQNERSLFSFLLSSEAFGLQDFAQQTAAPGTAFRIHHLYDYAAANFGHRLSLQTYRNHWNHIESLIRSFPANNDLEVAVLKTVGMLNLLNSPDLIPTEEALVLAVAELDTDEVGAVHKTVQRLHTERHVLYPRGRSGGYFLWAHTSVNLEVAYEEAGRAVGHQQRVALRIKDYLDNRPVVARRHYIQTGNLRHFEVLYCSLPEIESVVSSPLEKADGRIVVPLVETRDEAKTALQFATTLSDREDTVIGITEPLGSLAGLLQEVERWSWVEKHTPELKDDRYAAEEVARQLALATQTLEKRVQHFAGLGQSTAATSSIRWFCQGQERMVGSPKEFISFISDLCDRIYNKAPRLHNEIINRRNLSSAAAAARMRLVERMFASPEKQNLGMDLAKRPPEMSIYLSVLRQANLHVPDGSGWKLQEPSQKEDRCNLLPCLNRIREILESKPDERIAVSSLFAELRRSPYGMRDGVLPLLLVLVLLEHQHEIALYENGTFLSQVASEEILRLTKLPHTFELQLCRIHGVRRELFDKLSEMLGVGATSLKKTDILAVVRPLCIFVAQLPDYTRNTQRLGVGARVVRDALLAAREPATLLFRTLPVALGLEPFSPGEMERRGNLRVQEYIASLRAALDELKMAIPQLKDRVRGHIAAAFAVQKDPARFQVFRNALAERSQNMVVQVTDMDLKAFCLRLMDNALPEGEWIESVGSLVAATPPSRWKDSDEAVFAERLVPLVKKFIRIESLCFDSTRKKHARATFRVDLTHTDGTDRNQVLHLQPEEESTAEQLDKEIASLLKRHDARISLSALSNNIWRLLGTNHDK